MRVVLDTNVFISGIFWEGNFCSLIIDSWKERRLELITSMEIIEELVETLKCFKIRLEDEIIIGWRNIIIENSTIVQPESIFEIIKEDKEDNKFLDCAVEGKADLIITQDNHLLKIGNFQGIKIVNPEEALKLIED